ncbi:MAG: hypothetical protein KAV87_28095 [Desulfobacteraceae bacterium]|nr:hypothetical protein [Desulfobacteraceae bacterium]
MSVTITPDIGHIVLGCIICAMAIKGWVVDSINRKDRCTLTKKLMAQDGSLGSYAAGQSALKDADNDEISLEEARGVIEKAEDEFNDYDTLPVD